MNSWSRDDGLSAPEILSGLRSGDWPGWDLVVVICKEFLVFLGGVLRVIVMLEDPSRPFKHGIVQFLHLGSHLMEYAVVGLTVHNSLNPLQDPHARRVETAPHHYFATPMLDSWCEAVIFEFLKRTSSNVSVP